MSSELAEKFLSESQDGVESTLTSDEFEEVIKKFVSDAVDYVESKYTKEELPKERKILASYLRDRFNIAIKDLQVNMTDGMPYLIFEYIDDQNSVKESKINVKKWEGNFV